MTVTHLSFWIATAERAGKTAAQTLIALWGAGVFNILDANWGQALGVAGGAALLSVLSSIASAGVGPDGSPSLVGADPAPRT